jgi:hypothetical protein
MLGKIQGLEELVIKGHYAKNWPAYLERRMSVPVRSICGDFREEGYLTDEDLEDKEFIRKYNQRELETYGKYQQETEDLIT